MYFVDTNILTEKEYTRNLQSSLVVYDLCLLLCKTIYSKKTFKIIMYDDENLLYIFFDAI